jgi:predicted GIY-YIG superfamily endonuclease
MYFVYSLICEGKVFYIGKTKNLADRYSSHLNSCNNSRTRVAQYIGELLASSKIIDMNPMYYLSHKQAIEKEADIIYSFYISGQPILNMTNIGGFRKGAARQKPVYASSKQIKKSLTLYQLQKESAHACINRFYNAQEYVDKQRNYEQAKGNG